MLLREQSLLRQWRNIEKAPTGAGTAAAVGKNRESSCGSRHYCGSGEKQRRFLLEQALLQQWGNIEKVPAGAGTAAAVGKYREGSCWSRHCCGSEENSWWGFLWWHGAVGKGRGNGPLWVVEGRGEERLLWGFGGVFKRDGRLGSGGLP